MAVPAVAPSTLHIIRTFAPCSIPGKLSLDFICQLNSPCRFMVSTHYSILEQKNISKVFMGPRPQSSRKQHGPSDASHQIFSST
jgi:hypothetical protein